MDVIRDLLLFMEQHQDGLFVYDELPPLPTMQSTVEHVQMLCSGGFLIETHQKAFRVSWEGHEFIDKIRDPEIWLKTKEGASKLNSWGIKLIGEIATGYIKAKATELGIPLA